MPTLSKKKRERRIRSFSFLLIFLMLVSIFAPLCTALVSYHDVFEYTPGTSYYNVTGNIDDYVILLNNTYPMYIDSLSINFGTLDIGSGNLLSVFYPAEWDSGMGTYKIVDEGFGMTLIFRDVLGGSGGWETTSTEFLSTDNVIPGMIPGVSCYAILFGHDDKTTFNVSKVNTGWNAGYYRGNNTADTFTFEINISGNMLNITTMPVMNINATTATLNGNISDGIRTAVDCGFWVGDTSTNKTSFDQNITAGSHTEMDDFAAAVGSLVPGETYYVRAWAEVGGVYYGSETEVTFTVADIPDVINPGVATSGADGILVNWTYPAQVGSNITADRVQLYYDDENHSGWTRSNGTLIYNGSALNYLKDNLSYDEVAYFAIFTYNSTISYYSTTCVLINGTVIADPVDSVANFTATKISYSEINVTWSATLGADVIYIEYEPDLVLSPWEIGDGTLLYNGTLLYYNHTSLNPNRRYWYSAWGYNATYNVYSQINIIASAMTDVFEGVITLGDDPQSMVEIDDSKWSNKIYPEPCSWSGTSYQTWKLAIKAWYDYWDSQTDTTNWKDGVYLFGAYLWGGSTRWTTGYVGCYQALYRDNTAPYSWWSYWINNHNLDDGASSSKFNDQGTKTGKYPYHNMDPEKTNVIEMTYETPIRGAITGFGLYMEKDSEIRGYNKKYWSEGSKPDLPFDPRYRPFNLDYYIDDIYTSSAYSRIHLQINGHTVSCIPRDGSDGTWYNKQQYLFWDLELADEQVFIDNDPLNVSIWFETLSGVSEAFLVQTTGSDIDGDGYTGYRFASGTGAMAVYNDAYYSGTEDTARSLNYFLVYDPNLGSPGELGPGEQGTTFTAVDTLIIAPPTLGMYEQTNIIYLLNNTAYPTYLRIYNASGDQVFNKTLYVGSGNIFFTPITYGQFRVNLTRNSVTTTMGVFDVYSQVSHGWIYCDQNPVLKNDLFNVHVYYDITDYPAIVNLYDESGAEVWTWSLPANRTYKYDFTHTMTVSGKFKLVLSQVRPYDEQVVAQYTLWVKDTEYVPTITFSKTTPRINEPVTISITQNIVGTAYLQAKIWSVIQQKYIKIDNIGEKYVFSYTWTPDKFIGYHDVRMLLIVPYSPLIHLQNNTINVLDRLPTDEETDVAPVVNLPSLLNMGGNIIGIDDVMFKTILGALLVLFIMLLPLILAWRFKLRFADKILTNPMVYTMTAILGAVLAYAFGLFELWIFVLIFIVAITFMIRAWRGQQSSAGD